MDIKIDNIFFRFLAVISLLICVEGCKNDMGENLTTELRVITQIDSANQGNVKVYIYRTLADMEARLNPLDSAVSNAGGVALFKSLKSAQYFVFASVLKDGYVYDNSKEAYYFTDDLIENAVTIATIPLKKSYVENSSVFQVKSIQVIRYDTTEWGSKKNCSPILKFELIGVDNSFNDVILDSTKTIYDGVNEIQFCYVDKIPGNAVVASVKNGALVNINNYSVFYLNVGIFDGARYRNQSGTYYSRYLSLRISAVLSQNLLKMRERGLLPKRLRIMEGFANDGSRAIQTTVDLLVEWK